MVRDQNELSLHQRHPKFCISYCTLATPWFLFLKRRDSPEYPRCHLQGREPRKLHLPYADCENLKGQSFAEILQRRTISEYLPIVRD